MYTAKIADTKIVYTVGNVDISGRYENAIFLSYDNLFEGMLISDGNIRVNNRSIETVLNSGGQSIFRAYPNGWDAESRIFEGIRRGIVCGEVIVESTSGTDIVEYGSTKIEVSHEVDKIDITTTNMKESVLVVTIDNHILSTWDKIELSIDSKVIQSVDEIAEVFDPQNKDEPLYISNVNVYDTQFIIYLPQDTTVTIKKSTMNLLFSVGAGIFLTVICGVIIFRRRI
jgi:hypothetical protein